LLARQLCAVDEICDECFLLYPHGYPQKCIERMGCLIQVRGFATNDTTNRSGRLN
jgi:hypothetical protein